MQYVSRQVLLSGSVFLAVGTRKALRTEFNWAFKAISGRNYVGYSAMNVSEKPKCRFCCQKKSENIQKIIFGAN